MSVPTNIAEGAGQPTDRQFASFLGHALGSINESLSHLVLAERLHLLPDALIADWQTELLELRRMTLAFQRRLRSPASPETSKGTNTP